MSSEDVGEAQGALQSGTPVNSPVGFEKAVVMLQLPTGGLCTGTVIRQGWVLTARHCVLTGGGSVMAGNFTIFHKTLLTKGMSIPSANVFVHPDPIVDSALLKLPTSLDVGGDVQLFTGQDQDVPANVTTYGYAPFQSPLLNSTLSKASLPSHVARNAEMQNFMLYDNKYLVMGTNGSQAIIPGDSGGPSFSGSSLIATTGGSTATAYAKSFRKWVLDTIATSHPTPTMQTSFINPSFGVGGEWPMVGDVNGDGRSDLVNFVRDSVTGDRARDVEVSLASASGTYGATTRWHGDFASNVEIPVIGDFDGNGTADIVKLDADGSLDVSLSAASPAGSPGFFATERWFTGAGTTGEWPFAGDFNGDGLTDIALFKTAGGDVNVLYSCGKASVQTTLPAGCTKTHAFGTRQLFHPTFQASGETAGVGDFNADGIADIFRITASGDIKVALTLRKSCNTGADCGTQSPACWTDTHVCPADLVGETSPPSSTWGNGFMVQSGDQLKVGDVNGDGKADLILFHATTAHGLNGNVDIQLSNGKNGFGGDKLWGSPFCTEGQLCDVGDSNGDGRADGFMFVRSSVAGTGQGDVWVGLSK